ncbi:MAG: adenine phosphoribosyltransferase [Bacteroidales bacterium]|jgi:adenine phosphoribosyltransferase|nr:adenine phosphoribosyltransferase [Bacteroidales bacterium]
MIDIRKIRVVPDFPDAGIQFYDITTLLNDANAYEQVFLSLLDTAKQIQPDVIVALESRGYYFGPAIALNLHLPFVPIRKKGKLPFTTYQECYNLEYGQAEIEIHTDAMNKGLSVLLVDDVLATGGTARAACKLLQRFKPRALSTLFLLELKDLHGREQLSGYPVHTLLSV